MESSLARTLVLEFKHDVEVQKISTRNNKDTNVSDRYKIFRLYVDGDLNASDIAGYVREWYQRDASYAADMSKGRELLQHEKDAFEIIKEHAQLSEEQIAAVIERAKSALVEMVRQYELARGY